MTLIPRDDKYNAKQRKLKSAGKKKIKLNISVAQTHSRHAKLWIKSSESYQPAGLRAKHSFSRFYTLNIWLNITATENLDYIYMVKITVNYDGFTIFKIYHFWANPQVYQNLGQSKKWYHIHGFNSLLKRSPKVPFLCWARAGSQITLTKGLIL